MESTNDRIGKQAKEAAMKKPINLCLRYVARAVMRAIGEEQEDTGFESAKDSAPFFLQRGYKQIDTSHFINGDIVIMQPWQTQKHGHIMAFYEGKWYSDFAQAYFYPQEGRPKHKVYRYRT